MSTSSEPVHAVFKLPRSAYLAVLFLALGITVMVRSPLLTLLYLIPLLAVLFVERRGTYIDGETITVRAIFGRRTIKWTDVRGLLVGTRDGLSAVLPDGSALRLPYVRVRHLELLSQLTRGTVPALPPPPAEDEAAADQAETTAEPSTDPANGQTPTD